MKYKKYVIAAILSIALVGILIAGINLQSRPAYTEINAQENIDNSEYSVTFDKNGNSNKFWIQGYFKGNYFYNEKPICGLKSNKKNVDFSYNGEEFNRKSGIFFKVKKENLPITLSYSCNTKDANDPFIDYDDFTFTMQKDGTYSVRDNNAKLINSPKDLVIPAYYNGIIVTKVEDYASTYDKEGKRWTAWEKVTSMYIPNTITYIGMYAFADMDLLEEIFIPSSVKYIGADAFYNDKNLKKINCEINQKPVLWNTDWNVLYYYGMIKKRAKLSWGVTR